MGKTKSQCDSCREMITYGYQEDEAGNEGEVEIGHDSDCRYVDL